MKLVDQVGRKGTGQAKYSVTRIDWIVRSGSGDAKLITGQQPSDVNLVGARGHFT